MTRSAVLRSLRTIVPDTVIEQHEVRDIFASQPDVGLRGEDVAHLVLLDDGVWNDRPQRAEYGGAGHVCHSSMAPLTRGRGLRRESETQSTGELGAG